ncbi:hypothetical protein FJZ31_35775 [Candidatus Poribacteria bacterium]|nr:hypothetical protein [Candidatus Poribacteria bacterium]
MSKNSQLPEKIQELLKKKGWLWPPDEKLKAQWDSATERIHNSKQRFESAEEMLAVLEGERGFERVCETIRLRRKSSSGVQPPMNNKDYL